MIKQRLQNAIVFLLSVYSLLRWAWRLPRGENLAYHRSLLWPMG